MSEGLIKWDQDSMLSEGTSCCSAQTYPTIKEVAIQATVLRW